MKSSWHLKGPKPYDVQIEAMRRVSGHKRFGHWLEQRLGKTPLLLNDYIENVADSADTIFMFCPNSFKSNWALAPAEWGLDFTTSLWPKQSLQFGKGSRPHLNVLNYEVLRSGGFDTVRDMMKRKPCLLCFDESSIIGNFQSLITKGGLELSKHTEHVRELNGTPLTKDVMNLFPQLKMLGQFNGMNPYAFKGRYAVLGGYMGKKVVGVNPERELELQKVQESCTFRALRKDWWKDNPEKTTVPLHIEMTDRQRKHYREMLEEFYTLVKDDDYEAPTVLAQMDKLRQITSGIIMDGERVTILEDYKKNPKINAALDVLDSGTGKLVNVYFYKATGAMILEAFTKHKLNPAYIRGGMEPEEIQEQKDRFNNDPDCRVIVCQYNAGRMGHTLIGGQGEDACYRMFFHDNTFNMLDRAQIEDRIVHLNNKATGCLYFDTIMSPIDEAQLTALRDKASLADRVVNAVRAIRGKI